MISSRLCETNIVGNYISIGMYFDLINSKMTSFNAFLPTLPNIVFVKRTEKRFFLHNRENILTFSGRMLGPLDPASELRLVFIVICWFLELSFRDIVRKDQRRFWRITHIPAPTL